MAYGWQSFVENLIYVTYLEYNETDIHFGTDIKHVFCIM